IIGQGYLISFNLYPIFLATFIFLNVFLIVKPNDDKAIKLIMITYALSALFTLFSVYFMYYINITATMLSWHSIYAEKNTIAILNVFVILILISFKSKYKIISILKFLLIIFLVVFLIILKSRTATVGGLFAVICHFIYINKGSMKKIAIFLTITALSLIILLNDTLYKLLVVKLFLNDKVQSGSIDLSMVTSSRSDYVSVFVTSIQENFWLGSGYIRLESGFLYSLISFGILGAIPYITIAMLPFFTATKNIRNMENDLLKSLLLYSSAVAIVNFFLEQRAPFGPGTKFSFLWIVFGIYAKNYVSYSKKTKFNQKNSKE
ncbi:hypothetical protein, partial [Rossellomorea marisflavi]|uniref:hypothetical protein n=1 Tax=Rossellomorea marisflavi TaxID=189381 RepID=UPI00064F91D6